MKDNTYTLDVDIKKENYLDEPVVTQNDEVTFILLVTDDGEPFDLSDVSTFTLVSMRPDRQSIQTLGAKTSINEVTFNLGTSEISVPGRVSAAIQLYDADGRVSSIPFTYKVLPDLANGYIPSEDEKTLIQLVLGEGPGILADAKQATDEMKAMLPNLIGLESKGEYVNENSYLKNNIVSYQGSSYIAKDSTTGNLPTDSVRWSKIADKGDKGDEGKQGLRGLTGDTGPEGPRGLPGEQGLPGKDGTGSGTVTAVNNIPPDESGNVTLVIPDPDLTGLATKGELQTVEDSLATHKADESAHGIGNKATLLTSDKTSIVGALNELFTNANNLKTDWASVVGSPLLSGDTSAHLKSKSQTIKNKLATNLTTKGQTSVGTEPLDVLVDKVTLVNTGVLSSLVAADSGRIYVDTSSKYNNTSTYTKVKEVKMLSAGSGRITFELRTTNASIWAYGKVYINGVARGIERVSSTTTYPALSSTEDFTFAKNDLIQIYTKNGGGTISAICDTLTIGIDTTGVAQKIL